MSSIDSLDDRLKRLGMNDLYDKVDRSKYSSLSEHDKQLIRKIHPDSDAYQNLDQKCVFCSSKITKKDMTLPNIVYDSAAGAAYGDCLQFVLKKYPDIPVNQLEGKIARIRVEQSNI